MKSVMKHRFSEVPQVDIPRSTFDRSHGFKTTFDASGLVPCFIDVAYPGDTFKVNMTGFARMAPSALINPVMDNMTLETFFFAVPYRILWVNWKKFCGEQEDPGDSIDYTIPQLVLNNESNHSLADYFGLPTKVAANISVCSLPFRAYHRIFNDWFRDQNLVDSEPIETGNGPDASSYDLLKRAKKHDYFTSCLPWRQKEDPIYMPLGTTAPVYGEDMDFDNADDTANWVHVRDDIGGTSANLRTLKIDGASYLYGASSANGQGRLMTDLTNATAATVNELREAVQVQRILEKDARAGTRYTEIVKSHFGVDSPDARMQRPEYLGGGSSRININPVAETASGTAGELGAFGQVGFSNHGFVKSFTEHCIVMGLVNVRADITYQEGIERFWSDETRFDMYWPSLAHLGEQAVYNREIYVDAATIGAGTDDDVFGYQEAWAHLRYKPSRITGKFRSNDAASLDAWHLGVEFGAEPTLDDTFIEDASSTTIDRVISTASEPQFLLDSYFNFKCTRPLPIYSVPGYVDHF